jgi:MFS family permease
MSASEAQLGIRLDRRQVGILFLLLGAGFMLSADFSILNVAIPEIGTGVGLDVDRLAWITTSYALPAAGFTLLFGRLSDLWGRRRIFMTAMVILTIASFLGGAASGQAELLAARALQGTATAMAVPASLSLLTMTFPDGPLRAKVLGLNGALLSGGFSFGALCGGALVTALGWRAAFLVNVPIALLILIVTPVLIPRTKPLEARRLDVAGAITITAGLLAVIYGLIERDVPVVVVGGCLLAAFCVVERRAAVPLVPVHILGQAPIKWGNYAGFVVFAAETGMIFLATVHIQRAVGLSPLSTGLALGIPGLAAVVAGIIAGRLIGRYGAPRLLVAGMVVQAASTVPLLWVDSVRAVLLITIPCLFVSFFGHVTAIVAFTVTATTGLLSRDQGMAAGLISMTQQVAVTAGAPTLSAIAALPAIESSGTRLALATAAAFTVLSAVLVRRGLRATRQHTSRTPQAAGS